MFVVFWLCFSVYSFLVVVSLQDDLDMVVVGGWMDRGPFFFSFLFLSLLHALCGSLRDWLFVNVLGSDRIGSAFDDRC